MLPKGSEERGAYLRREGLYSSHLSEWRKQRDSGCDGRARAEGPAGETHRGAGRAGPAPAAQRRLEAELERTKTALEITGKVHALLEAISESADTETKSKP